tara:strand:- start:2768 stop:4654 length:1887 start_codon:yes stop_codon:yes gene_type:complete
VTVQKHQRLHILLWGINESLDLMKELCVYAVKTAETFGLKVDFIGLGHKFKAHIQRVQIAIDFLKRLEPSEIVILMDGSDTLFTDYEDQIFQKFIELDSRILISAEINFTHQYFQFKDRFDQIDSPYRYVNAGTMMGYAGDLLNMWLEMEEIAKTYPDANDQGLLGIWCYNYLSHPDKVKLDSSCKVFWVSASEHRRVMELANSKTTIYNPITKSKPAIFHITGNKDPMIRKIYLTLFSSIMEISNRESFRIVIISPLNRNENYFLWKPKDDVKRDKNRPIWYHDDHPNIISFFYGISDDEEPHIIRTNDFYEAVLKIKSKYFSDYIIHVPEGRIFHYNDLYDTVKSRYNEAEIQKMDGSDFATSESFIIYKNKYYDFNELTRVEDQELDLISNFTKKRKSYEENELLREYKINKPEYPFDVISLGGWCGPAIVCRDLKIRSTAYPFCMLHSSVDSLHEVVNENFEMFYKDREYTVMPHHDMSDPIQKDKMDERLEKFIERLKNAKPILFVRAMIHPDYNYEIQQMQILAEQINRKYDRNDKYVLALHDQNLKTTKLKMLSSKIMLCAVEGSSGWRVPNRGEMFDSYRRLICYAIDNDNWLYDIPHVKSHTIIEHKSYPIHKDLFDTN